MKKIINDLYISDLYSFYHYNFVPPKHFTGHCHPFWEINYILNGTMEMTYEDTVFVLKKGDLFIGEPGAFHKYTLSSGDRLEFYVIEFFSQSIELVYEPRLYRPGGNTLLLLGLIVDEIKKFEADTASTVKDGNYYPYIVKALLEAFLISILDEKSSIHNVTSKYVQIYNRAFNYMRRNCARNLSINDIAAHCDVCATQLKKAFAKHTGNGVMHFFMQLKIEKSKQLLAQQNTVSEVADALSFSSQSYFSYVFKQFEGISPKEYQKTVLRPS